MVETRYDPLSGFTELYDPSTWEMLGKFTFNVTSGSGTTVTITSPTTDEAKELIREAFQGHHVEFQTFH